MSELVSSSLKSRAVSEHSESIGSEPLDADRPLSEWFEAALAAFSNLGQTGPVTEEVFSRALDVMVKTAEKVRGASIFSPNETLDDLSTSSIKYLYIPYFHAKICCQCPVLEKRRNYIVEGNGYMQAFLSKCVSLGGVLQPEELDALVGPHEDGKRKPLSDAERRQRKIAKYKRDKEAHARIEFLRRFVASADEDDEDEEEFRLGGIDREPEVRELSILQLQSYARACIDDIEMNNQELAMLIMREESELQRRHQMEHDLRSRSDARTRDGASDARGHSSDSGTAHSHSLGSAVLAFTPEEYAARPGLTVTRLGKVGDEVVMRRETVKAEVFVPRMEGPSMSLEEFAAIEVAQAREREARERAGDPNIVKKYKQLEADGEEDNIDLVDKATVKERDWDAWKEDNPRGWGNKAGKLF